MKRPMMVFSVVMLLIAETAIAGPAFVLWRNAGGALAPVSSDYGISIGDGNPLTIDDDGDGDLDVIQGQYPVDLGTDNTYAITAHGAEYLFDIDALDSNCTVTLKEASLWIGQIIGVRLVGSNATYDLLLDPGDATDRFVDWDRATNLTTAAGEYISADGDGECVYLQAVGADTIAIINADGSLPSGWTEE